MKLRPVENRPTYTARFSSVSLRLVWSAEETFPASCLNAPARWPDQTGIVDAVVNVLVDDRRSPTSSANAPAFYAAADLVVFSHIWCTDVQNLPSR